MLYYFAENVYATMKNVFNLGGYEYKIETFHTNKKLKKKFRASIPNLNFKNLLWPHEHWQCFAKEFLFDYTFHNEKRIGVYPIFQLSTRLDAVKIYIDYHFELFCNLNVNELMGYFNNFFLLKKFELQAKEFQKKYKLKTAECKEFYEMNDYLQNEIIQNVSKKFPVAYKSSSRNIFLLLLKDMQKEFFLKSLVRKQNKNVYTLNRLHKHLLSASNVIKRDNLKDRSFASLPLRKQLGIEANEYSKNDSELLYDLDKEEELELGDVLNQKKQIDELTKKNNELNLLLKEERKHVTILKNEIAKITEEALRIQGIGETSILLEEYRNLKEKNKAILAKNIELSNLLEHILKNEGFKLEDILNKIKLRINTLIRNPYTNNARVLAECLKKEIFELQRARTYLGGTLFDLGILYLKLGNKKAALVEFKAARELGVMEVEEVIHSIHL